MTIKRRQLLIAGTRGSPLALAQTQSVLSSIRKKNPNVVVRKRVILTSGDRIRSHNPMLTGKDSFTRQIDLALINGSIHLAVHSLKDLPVDKSVEIKGQKLEICAYPKRESPLDVLIGRESGMTLQTLPKRARIGTSSVRRAIQLKRFRPDFQISKVHGNVTTRIRKLRGGELNLDGLVLAQAGMKRLNVEGEYGQVIPVDIMLPAVGQGCLAVMVRSNDLATKKIVRTINNKRTELCVRAERAFSRELGGGCNTPIGALATIKGSRLTLEGFVGRKSKSRTALADTVLRGKLEGRASDPESLGKRLAKKLKVA